jgi:hypothetical protein
MVQGNLRTSDHHEVLLRLQNGAIQTVTFAAERGYWIDDKVNINDRVIVRGR